MRTPRQYRVSLLRAELPASSFRRWHAAGLVLVAALAASTGARAEQHVVTGDTARASASLDFRIVIPETVRIEHGREQRDATRQYTSRSVETTGDGREVVTIARP